ncbi:MAG: TIGR03960 family B12-binding radical SAM protein [Eubacteriales bacterium]|nr:TIGR03960 family B12-binding radical SAM protein [Eubacteriales bacterium]
MNNKVEKFLLKVQKPSRYTGGEYNSIVKDNKENLIRFAFCFPDTYEVGMSHLGMRILYGMYNERPDTWCERVFAPWEDMELLMRENDVKLYGLESGDPICDFDFVGFTLQYEMSYSNILNMLELGGIPLLASERGEDMPFVVVGGPCAYNCEPIADFVDLVLLGEGEELNSEILDLYAQWKNSGKSRHEFLVMACAIEGVYVPSFYDVEYNEDNTVKSITPKYDFAPRSVRKRIVEDLDKVYYPTNVIVPSTEIVHDRMILELFRGCGRGCRFCQAGMVYRPIREKSAETLIKQAQELIESTGYEEIALTSLSTSDYTQLKELCDGLLKITEEKKIGLSLPSLRVDNFSVELMHKIQKVRKSGLTFAPEAGTQRLRDVINKNIYEEDLRRSVSLAFGGGWSGVKLYFMIGLPTETDEDIVGIASLAQLVGDEYFKTPKEQRNRGLSVTVSTSTFVPKPFTPFQWEPQIPQTETVRRQELLKKALNQKWTRYNWHDSKTSYLEGVFARGDRRLSKVLIAAHNNGCKFDGWSDLFNYDGWMSAFEQEGIDPDFYALRRRELDEVLPWDHIDVGVTKDFLKSEWEKAQKGETTVQCREGCSGCGAMSFEGSVFCG